MIMKVSSSDRESCVREIFVGEGQPAVGVTLGPASYLVSGSLEYGDWNCHVLIGRYSSLAHRIKFLVGFNHSGEGVTTYPFLNLSIGDGMAHDHEANQYQIIIGNDVLVGSDATILGGVRIGNGAMIAANSVVTKDVPPYALVAGNPARVKKYRFSNDIIDKLQEIKWWNWPEDTIKENLEYMKVPQLFVERFYPSSVYIMNNQTVSRLQSLRKNKNVVYAFIADFDARNPVWKNVLDQYLNFFQERTDSLLLFATSTQEEYDRHINEVQSILDSFSGRVPSVALIGGISTALPEFVRCADGFITTREDVSSICVDFAAGRNIRILSGLNYFIFGKDPMHLQQFA